VRTRLFSQRGDRRRHELSSQTDSPIPGTQAKQGDKNDDRAASAPTGGAKDARGHPRGPLCLQLGWADEDTSDETLPATLDDVKQRGYEKESRSNSQIAPCTIGTYPTKGGDHGALASSKESPSHGRQGLNPVRWFRRRAQGEPPPQGIANRAGRAGQRVDGVCGRHDAIFSTSGLGRRVRNVMESSLDGHDKRSPGEGVALTAQPLEWP